MNKLEPIQRLQCILETVDKLEADYPDGVPIEKVVEFVVEQGHDEEEAYRDIENLAEYVGYLDAPKDDHYLIPRARD
jgi:hypothetical protein